MAQKDDLLQSNADALSNTGFAPGTDDRADPATDFTDGTVDLSKKAVLKLGQFLSDRVSAPRDNGTGQKNAFVPPTSPSVALSGKRGSDISPLPSSDSGANVFTRQDDSQNLRSAGLGVGSRLGTFFKDEQVKGLLDKTGATDDKTGHGLLRDIKLDGSAPVPKPGQQPEYGPVSQNDNRYLSYVLEQLTAANLYHPTSESPFVTDPAAAASGAEEIATQGLFTVQRDLGSFDKDGQRVKVSDMTKMALSSLARAAGDDDVAASVLAGSSIGLGLKGALELQEQLGISGIDVRRLHLDGLASPNLVRTITDAARGNRDILATAGGKNLSGRNVGPRSLASGGDGTPGQSTPYNFTSYGQLNYYLEPFGSVGGSPGMLAIALSGIAALLAVAVVVDLIAGSFGEPTKSKGYVDPRAPSGYAYGSHTKAAGDNLDRFLNTLAYDLLGITKTDYDFGDCVSQGIALLLGFSPEGATANVALQIANPTTLGNFALNLLASPAYYVVMFRQIIRDANDLTSRFKDIGAGGVSSDYSALVQAIEKLTRSKAWRFIMIAAGVGDAAIKSANGYPGRGTDVLVRKGKEPPAPITVGDADAETLATISLRTRASRWKSGKNQLSLVTFPAIRNSINGNSNAKGLRNSRNSSSKPSPEMVRKIEAALEADYVPFYFHDLRTHEIFSLPAFVTDFGETFNASYNAVKGYGRQDAVQVYNGTDRTMTFAFKLVSYNQEDHDEMWYTVNRLVAMCYPQYSKGRQRSIDDGEARYGFIQPFSQVPAASPVIRLRFGDVLKSNYTNANLRRLFGDVKITNGESSDEVVKAKKKLEEAKDLFAKKLLDRVKRTLEQANTFGLATVALAASEFCFLNKAVKGYKLMDSPAQNRITLANYGQRGQKTLNLDAIIQQNGNAFEFIGGKSSPDGKSGVFRVKDTRPDAPSPGTFSILITESSSFTPGLTSAVKKRAESDPGVQVAKKELEAARKAVPADYEQKRENFFESKNNAIVRSFESTRGKGMAGVITSLGLAYGNYPWEIAQGSQAPKVIDVSLSFTPIHDLPLGLDFDGSLRAASHPVGGVMTEMGSVYEDELAVSLLVDLAIEEAVNKANNQTTLENSIPGGPPSKP